MNAWISEAAALTGTDRTPDASMLRLQIDDLDSWHNPGRTQATFTWICYAADESAALPAAA